MKKTYTYLILALITFAAKAQTDLNYYLPLDQNYNPNIPTPTEILGHDVGKWHVSHDKLSEYMRTLAATSDRIQVENRGRTYEDRPLLLLTITSEDNHKKLDQIKADHIALTEPEEQDLDTSTMPVIVYQGFSIHGNEPSGANAGLLVAYHLAASQSDQVVELLEDTVILLIPVLIQMVYNDSHNGLIPTKRKILHQIAMIESTMSHGLEGERITTGLI